MTSEKTRLYAEKPPVDEERGTTPTAPPGEEEEAETLRASDSFPGTSKEAALSEVGQSSSGKQFDPEYGRTWPWPKYDIHGTDLDWEALKLCLILVALIIFLILFILYFVVVDPNYTTFRRKMYH